LESLFVIAFLVVVFLLITLVFLFFRKSQTYVTQLSESKEAAARSQQSEESLKSLLADSTEEVQQLRLRLEEEMTRSTELSTQNENLRQAMDKEKAILEEAQTKLQDAFKSLAAQSLESNNKQFLDLAKSVLETEKAENQSQLERRKVAIEELVKPINETLIQYQKNLGDVEKQRVQAYTTLESEIKKVAETHDTLAKHTLALKDALKKPHIRGRWGEVQLKNCIELAGMSEYSDVSFQDSSTDNDGKNLRPDMVVRMPGNRKVIVDCKTPIDAFMSSLEANTEEEAAAEMARHGKHVKKHVQDLSTKDYAANLRGSADFTVMFLPNESFLYAALEAEPDLMEFALQRKILVATPPTLIGLLKVIRYGWNEEALAENAFRISEVGKELHKRVCDFVEAYTAVGKHLDKAREEYDRGFTRLESRVITQARKLEKLGAKGKKELPEGMGLLEEARDVGGEAEA
tara:strand:- start:3557 stop:4939 length:1383 start_codon:yes stop_codon:yes gene_type:complete